MRYERPQPRPEADDRDRPEKERIPRPEADERKEPALFCSIPGNEKGTVYYLPLS